MAEDRGEWVARLVELPLAALVWVGQQLDRWRRRPRFHRYGWTCGTCGRLKFTFAEALRCDHGRGAA